MLAVLIDVSTVAATVLAVVVVVVGSLRWVRSRAASTWRRTIQKSLRGTRHVDPDRLKAMRERAVGHGSLDRDAAQEVSDILGLFRHAPSFLVGHGPDAALLPTEAGAVRDAYRRYAATLSRRGSHPWGDHQIALARDVAEVVQSAIDGVPSGDPGPPDADPTVLTLVGTGFRLDLVRTPGPCDVAVAYRAAPHPESESAVDQPPAVLGRSYDGWLPWLTGTRLETDATNGRPRLHLAFSQTTYYRFRGINAARLARWGDEPTALPDTGLLTLSCTPVDSGGHLLLSRRDERLEHRPGAVSAFATGNLDLRARRKVGHDFDPLGLPDPLRAIAREVREETGTPVSHTDVHAVGLAQVWSHHDRGTWVLSCTTQLSTPWQDVVARFRQGDPVEGSWEVGQDLLVLDLPEDVPGAAAVVHGLATAPDVVPHVVADVVAIAVSRGVDRGELGEAVLARTGHDDSAALRAALIEVPIERPFARRRT
ncbi:hypothetical protein [Cellulomonas sp.]|uniref:hypothetical protein n=1 Tax=Cellulomonas sp. TaxID=40001 RepID=UPI00258E4E73|nr:hypothetical protein [Cellulomonas sp.]MCR6690370.1 hypothetical protein [Cellulomonas sp.]